MPQNERHNTSVNIDVKLIAWVDDMIKLKTFSNRNHAIELGLQRLKDSMTPESDSLSFVDATTLLELPGHIQKTMRTLMGGGRMTAEDVSRITRRARAVESQYLNQLVSMKKVDKERIGLKVFFIAKLYHE